MRLRIFLLPSTFAIMLGAWAACDETPSGCTDARIAMQNSIGYACTDSAYASTPFCTCCVTNGYYSVSNDCTCRALQLDTGTCYYSVDAEADPMVRDAIEFANSICKDRLVNVPSLDASTGQCKGPNNDTTSSSSGSMQGTGGSGTTSSSSTTGMMGTGGTP